MGEGSGCSDICSRLLTRHAVLDNKRTLSLSDDIKSDKLSVVVLLAIYYMYFDHFIFESSPLTSFAKLLEELFEEFCTSS